MSLMDTLAQQGITAEDLEKAASARLFEIAASEEGVDLTTLSEPQIEQLYTEWVAQQTPAAEPAKVAAAPAQPAAAAPATKVASAAEVEEAQAKLAEAEILGRHMARSFWDENQKIATATAATKGMPFNKARMAMKGAVDKMKAHKGKAIAGAAAAGAAGAGAAAAAKKAKDGKKEASTENFDALANARAVEILQSNGYDVNDAGQVVKAANADAPPAETPAEQPEVTLEQAVETAAWELLSQHGFTKAE